MTMMTRYGNGKEMVQERWVMNRHWGEQRIAWEQGRNAIEVIEIDDDDD